MHRRIGLWREINEAADDAVFGCQRGRVLGVGLVFDVLDGHGETLSRPWNLEDAIRPRREASAEGRTHVENGTFILGLVKARAGNLALQPKGSVSLVVVRGNQSSWMSRRGVHLAVLRDLGRRWGSHGD